jgi:hypothetical protein
MTPENEEEVLTKVRETHTLLVGIPGQRNTGFIERTENRFEDHDKRLTKLERTVLKAATAVGLIWFGIETWMHWNGH